MQSLLKTSLKKSAITLAIFGFSVSAFAWQSNVTGFILGAEGLYFQARNGDLDYLTINPESGSVVNNAVNTTAISPDYHWGYRLFGGLKFCDNDDLVLTWWQVNAGKDSASHEGRVINSSPKWLLDDTWEDVNSSVKNDLTDVSLVLGHTLHFNNAWTIRFAGGLEYAKIDNNLFTAAFFPFSPGVFLGTYTYESKTETKGFGPRLEFDANYFLTNCFSVFLNSNAALLVSKRDLSLTGTNPPDAAAITLPFSFANRHVIIPKFGLRLGGNFGYRFGNGDCGPVFNLDAGWEVDTFIHAIERPNGDVGSYFQFGGFNEQFASTHVSNLTVQGPFVGVNVNWS